MADENTYGFSKDDATALIQAIGTGENWYPESKPRGSRINRAAVIGSTLTAPADSLVAATTCTIYVLVLQTDGTQVVNVNAETAYNDDPEVTADIGTYCRVERLNGRWMIYYMGCDVQSALVAALP